MTHTDETPDNLEAMAKELANELFDKFVYGGWEADQAWELTLEALRTAHAQGAESTPIADDVKGLADTILKMGYGRDPNDFWEELIDKAASIIQAFIDSRTGWRDIESAPVDVEVLLYCPERGIANNERIELGYAHTSRGSHHSWATKWQPLPTPPAGKGE